MTNEEKAKFLADQCKPCTDDFYSGFYQGALVAFNAESRWIPFDQKLPKEGDSIITRFYFDGWNHESYDNITKDQIINVSESYSSWCKLND